MFLSVRVWHNNCVNHERGEMTRKAPFELRDWLEKRLGLGDRFEHVWAWLEQDHYVSEYLQGEGDEQTVLEAARKLRDRGAAWASAPAFSSPPAHARERGEASPPRYFDVTLSEREEEHGFAFREALAREASLSAGPSGEVVIAKFRQRLMGDRLLTEEQAHEFLESPATRFMPLRLFEGWDVPLIGHEAEVLKHDIAPHAEPLKHTVVLKLHPPGLTKTLRYGKARAPDKESVDAQWSHDRGDPDEPIDPRVRTIKYTAREGDTEEFYVWPGSVLDSVRSFCSHWARIYGWPESETVLWFLSGRPPSLKPLSGKVSYRKGSPLRVTLEIQPWVSAETIYRNYRRWQKQIHGDNYRNPGLRSLRIVRFVEHSIRQEGKRPSWQTLLERWNAAHSAKEQFSNRSNFARAYRDTIDKLLHEPFIMPFRKPLTPVLQAKMKKKAQEAHEAVLRALGGFADNSRD